MTQMIDISLWLAFPTVIRSILVGVAAVYWLFVIVGALDVDAHGHGGDMDAGGVGGHGGDAGGSDAGAAKGAEPEDIPITDLAHAYSAVELGDILSVLRHLGRCQQDRHYIESAAQDDCSRTEPLFELQGSYRNMNELAEKLVAAMSEDEVERVIDDHYQGEAQTLTTYAEHNLLRLAILRDRMSAQERARPRARTNTCAFAAWAAAAMIRCPGSPAP